MRNPKKEHAVAGKRRRHSAPVLNSAWRFLTVCFFVKFGMRHEDNDQMDGVQETRIEPVFGATVDNSSRGFWRIISSIRTRCSTSVVCVS